MDEPSSIDWKKDSQSFDSVAGLYDKFRPAYPRRLVDCIIEWSGLNEGARILEVGSGTGKATRFFASRGYSIHCVEPGRNLAAVAARNLKAFPLVTFEVDRYEQSQDRSGEFDLVLSAQAFHWVSKDIGYAKVAKALKPAGSLALFWNMYPGLPGPIAVDLDRIYHEIVPGLDSPNTASEEVIRDRINDINQSACFGPVTVRCFPWSKTYRTGEYLGLINTYSDHLRLSEPTRQRLFHAIATAIDGQGGSIKREYVAVLFLAKKLS
jgi:SAM-dependent methyltransferase